MTKHTTERDFGYKQLRHEIAKAVGRTSVKIGFLDDGMGADEHGQSGTRVIEVAFWNEFGTIYIPERPFFRTSIDSNRKKINSYADSLMGRVFDGRLTIETALKRIGLYVVDLVKQSITDWATPPNSPETIARKGANNPLIDTGQMRASVQFEVTL